MGKAKQSSSKLGSGQSGRLDVSIMIRKLRYILLYYYYLLLLLLLLLSITLPFTLLFLLLYHLVARGKPTEVTKPKKGGHNRSWINCQVTPPLPPPLP